jgi:CPA2 family monovalent cation:H+ antiporter-2
VLICLAVAWVTSSFGLSLALGAFLAGLIISESEYSHHALSNILPFKDIFTSLFFVSVGMLLDISYFLTHPFIILFTTIGIMILKTSLAGTASAMLGYPFRTNMLVGLALCQVGEFSFILSKSGLQHGLIDGDMYQIFLSVSVLTMAITPFIIQGAPEFINLISKLPMPDWFKSGLYSTRESDIETKIKNHIVIIGYGLNGRVISKAVKEVNLPYVIIDTNPETVTFESQKGEPIFFGDATQEAILKKANVKHAKVVVIVTSDLYATNLITKLVKSLNPNAHIVVRTKYFQQTKIFQELGANAAVSEEIADRA